MTSFFLLNVALAVVDEAREDFAEEAADEAAEEEEKQAEKELEVSHLETSGSYDHRPRWRWSIATIELHDMVELYSIHI